MGLDQYAYAAIKANQFNEFYESGTWDSAQHDYVQAAVSKPREIAYWRKHPNLQGWMERLWLRKNGYATDPGQQFVEGKQAPSFNGIEVELTWEDLDQLERDIKRGSVAKLGTKGFFFGNPSDDYYRDYDLEFVQNAKAEVFLGLKVFYNSSW